nr:hypothetical protein [Ornithinimicrobium cavernae]
MTVLVPLSVYALTQSVTLLALTFLGRLLLSAATGWGGGWLADRAPRRALLMWSLVSRITLLSVLLAPLPMWAFALVGVTLGAVGAFDNPAAEAGLRVLHRHELTSLAVVRKAGQALSQMVGPALAGLLVGLGGSTIGFFGSLVLLALALLLLRGVGHLEDAGDGQAIPVMASPSLPELHRVMASWTLPTFIATLFSSLLVVS